MTRLIDADKLKEAINTWDKFACLPDGELEPFRNLEHPEMFEPYIHLRDVIKAIDGMQTVEDKKVPIGYDYGDVKTYKTEDKYKVSCLHTDSITKTNTNLNN